MKQKTQTPEHMNKRAKIIKNNPEALLFELRTGVSGLTGMR